MATLAVQDLSKLYAGNAGVDQVSFAIESGTFLTLLGPSGCGKTTTLRMVAGLVAPDRGRILIGGQEVTREHASRRNIGMVFQNLALFPHMTVSENVRFGLRMRKVPNAEADARVARALAMVKLDQLGRKYPAQMSGGQQQRTALARALVIEPSLLVLDEPFAALDRKLREAMQTELRRLVKELGMTALFVTHDQEEALTLSDYVAVMNTGRIEQFGTPAEVFGAPRTPFVADFMGATNILPARLEGLSGGGARLRVAGLTLPVAGPSGIRGADRALEVAVRPERISILRHDPGADQGVPGDVVEATYHGAVYRYVVRVAPDLNLEAREAAPFVDASQAIPVGARVWLAWPDEAIQVLEPLAAPELAGRLS